VPSHPQHVPYSLPQVVQVPLPSVDVDVRGARLPPPVMAYLAGALFALAASPCSTPVLATLLAYVSSKQDPVQAALLLLLYSCGYVSPLLVAASATVCMGGGRHGVGVGGNWCVIGQPWRLAAVQAMLPTLVYLTLVDILSFACLCRNGCAWCLLVVTAVKRGAASNYCNDKATYHCA
jgi:hypothetical protein